MFPIARPQGLLNFMFSLKGDLGKCLVISALPKTVATQNPPEGIIRLVKNEMRVKYVLMIVSPLWRGHDQHSWLPPGW